MAANRQIRSLVLRVGLVGSRRLCPAHVGCLVDRDGSRRVPSDRLDDQRDDQGARLRALGHPGTRGSNTILGIMVNMEGPDPNPASLSPEEREARLNAVLADVRASHNTAEGVLIVGGREAQLLWYATVDAYIAGNWVATILCGQATCERVLAGLVSLSELPGAGIIGPKGWERWGLGKLIGHIRSLGWVPDDLLDNVTQVCEVRKPFGHWRQPLDPGTPWRRIAEQLSAVPQLNPDELVERLAAADPDELVERLIAADAELAAVTALQLYLGGYGVGPYESPSHR